MHSAHAQIKFFVLFFVVVRMQVKQFCKTVPKFGTEVVKKKRASVSGGGEGAVEGGASKRLRAGDLLPGTYAAALPSPVVGAGAATTAQAALRPQSASSSSSSSSRQSSTVVLGSNMTAADDDAFFATADAKLRYLSSTASRVAGGTNAASARPSSAMQPISLMPLASSAAAWAATNPNVNTNAASAKSSSKRTASGAAGVVASQPANSSSGLSNNSSGSSKAVSSAVASSKSNTTTVRAGAVVGSNTPLTVGSTASSSSIANSKAPPSTAVATTKKAAKAAATLAAAEAKALFQKHSVSAAISTESSTPIRATTMSAVARSGAAPPATPTPVIITVNKNLLTGSAYKNLDVFDHCKNVRTLEEKLEISKDMHAYIIVSFVLSRSLLYCTVCTFSFCMFIFSSVAQYIYMPF